MPETYKACPTCGSESLRDQGFDYGIDMETGYHDEGTAFRCRVCGASGGADDTVVLRNEKRKVEK